MCSDTQPHSWPWTRPPLWRVEVLTSCRCESLSEHAWRYSLLPNDAFMRLPPRPRVSLPSLLLTSDFTLPPLCLFLYTLKLFIIFTHLSVFIFNSSNLTFHTLLPLPFSPLLCHPPPHPSHPPPFFSSLSGTITPSVVAAKREQMLELLPTQCTKPPTAGLWILSLLLLHSHKEHRAATPAPALASTSHLQQGRVDRFTYTACNVSRGKKRAVGEYLPEAVCLNLKE